MIEDRLRMEFDEIARLSGYADGDNRYDEFLIRQIPAWTASVLDIGCGPGRLTNRLANSDRLVIGIDLSPEMIARAHNYVGNSRKLEFYCDNFLRMQFERSFDLVLSVATLHHMPLDTAIARMIELVQPGGTLIIHDLRSDSTLFERINTVVAGAVDCLGRLITTGHLFPNRTLRAAWLKHGANETYLTMQQVFALADTFLPRAKVYKHWFWRYTIVWQKSQESWKVKEVTS